MKKLIFILLFCSSIMASEKPYFFIPDNSNFMIYNKSGKIFIINQNKSIQNSIYKNIQKISSGKKIISSSDDASGLAISEKMKSQINSLKRQAMNDADYRNYLAYKESIIQQDIELLKRINYLLLQASNGIYSKDDRALIQPEINELLSAIESNSKYSAFNTKLVIPEITKRYLGIENVSAVVSPYDSLKSVNLAIDKLIRIRSNLGAQDRILKLKIEGKYYYIFNLTQSMSNIIDSNIAEEISNFEKNSVLLKVNNGLIIIKE